MTTKATEVGAPAPTPTPAPGEVNGHCPLALIRPCPFNVRKAFDDADIAELAVSIREIGLTERLLVRPVGADGKVPQYVKGQWHDLNHFELVDGERRYRALSLLNETHAVERVPITIRDMTDDQVRAVMLASREQSRDLAASELVAGYRELAEGRTADEVAAMVGRTPAHVRSVLRLAKLPAWALAAVDAGTLPRSVAELAAAVPGEAGAAECIAWIAAGDRYGYAPGKKPPKPTAEPMTYREAREFIGKHFQVELKSAPFSRVALDLVEGTGSCEECPKRAGNNEDAKAAGVRADMCLDPTCYRAKVEAHNKLVVQAAKESGRAIMPAKEADKVFENYGNHRVSYSAPYVDLDATCYDAPGNKTYRQVLKGSDAAVVLAIDPAGVPRELAKKDAAAKVIREKYKKPVSASKGDSQYDRQEKERKARAAAGAKAALVANGTVAAKAELVVKLIAESPSQLAMILRPLARIMAKEMWNDASRLVAKRRNLGTSDHRTLVAAEANNCNTAAEALGLIAELVAARLSFGWSSPYGSATMGGDEVAFWDAFGVSKAKLLKDAAAEQKEAKKPRGPDKQRTKPDTLAPPHPPVTKPVGSFPIKDVPNFPVAGVAVLAQSGVHTLADLEPHVNKQIAAKKDSPIFEALRALGLGGLPCLFDAGDALVDHLHPKAPDAVSPSAKGAANGKAKKARAAAKGSR